MCPKEGKLVKAATMSAADPISVVYIGHGKRPLPTGSARLVFKLRLLATRPKPRFRIIRLA